MKVIVVILLFLPSIVLADTHIQNLQKHIPAMLDFIESNTQLEYDDQPYPQLIEKNAAEICRLIYDPPKGPDCDVAGYYDHDLNEIIIIDRPTQFMSDDRFQEVILLQELVHFLQYTNGINETVECRQNLETTAFELQEIYVDQMGIDPEQKPDPLFTLFVSMCPGMMPMLGEQ